jgi:hypothetical protein
MMVFPASALVRSIILVHYPYFGTKRGVRKLERENLKGRSGLPIKQPGE